MQERTRIGWPLLGLAVPLVAYAVLTFRNAEQSTRQARTGAFGAKRAVDEPRSVQYSRAIEAGRGRQSKSPWQIPWAGWKDILWRTYQQICEDRLMAVAAGVVFYGLLATFPAVTALVSLYGLFASPASIADHLASVGSFLPQGTLDIIREQVTRIAAKGEAKLGFTFLFGLALALWSANAGVKAVIDALNVIYDEKEKRGFFKLNLVSLAFTIAGLFAVLIAISAVVAIPVVLTFVNLGGWTETLVQVLRWPALLVMVMIALALLYRYGPSRREARWQWLSVGSIFAAAAWLGSSALLSWYIANFGSYDATYGSLGAAIGMMTWMWLSSIVILFGAELNSEIEHQTAADTTTQGDKPLGTRGAAMADTVGRAA
jgi:membrane protein